MLIARDKNNTQAPSDYIITVVVEKPQLHFNSFEFESLAALKLVRYERLKW